MPVYQKWLELILMQFTHLKKWQATGLALISYGIIVSKACQVTKISEALGAFGRLSSVEKRLKRWLKNSRIDVTGCCEVWIRWVWASGHFDRAVLLVDETKLGNRMAAMVVCLAFEKRAIPLMWRCYRANHKASYPPEGQVAMIVTMLSRVIGCLPPESRPLIQADRGIGCSSKLMKACQQRGWYFLFRVHKNVYVKTRGRQKQLKHLAHYGEVWCGYGQVFKKKHQILHAYVFVAWQPGQREPWCLVSNDPLVESQLYAVRMWQELSFKDLKSAGWQWQLSHLEDPHRSSRLLLAMTLAYGWILTQGSFVMHDDDLLRDICDGQLRHYSIFRAGLRLFKRMLHRPEQIYVGLCFVPRYKPLPKTVPS